MADPNPFSEYFAAVERCEDEIRARREALSEMRDEIGIKLLRTGYSLRRINEFLGTKNPNWLYAACSKRGLGTPGKVREHAKADGPTITLTPIDGGYIAEAKGTAESATFTWDEDAEAYTPSDVIATRGSDMHRAVRGFGRGLLPFPYKGSKNPETS